MGGPVTEPKVAHAYWVFVVSTAGVLLWRYQEPPLATDLREQ